jgi:hypothetical protein
MNPWSVPKAHRTAVVAVDASDPVVNTGAIDTGEAELCRFDISLNSGAPTYPIEVQALFWNERLSAYVRGAKGTITELPSSLAVECRGAKVYCKVVTLAGTSPNISIDYALA